MERSAAKSGNDLVRAGIEAVQRRRPDLAGGLFLKALDHFAEMQDCAHGRNELMEAAPVLTDAGFPDLALMAVGEAIGIDEQVKDRRNLAVDLLEIGNLLRDLGRMPAAEAAFKRALSGALESGCLDIAGAASTNAAILMLYEGREGAIEQLQQSLAYFAEGPSSNNEINTRLALIHAVDQKQGDPAIAVEAATGVFSRCSLEPSDERWATVDGPFRRCVDRYLGAHQELDGAAWKQKTFPWLYQAGR